TPMTEQGRNMAFSRFLPIFLGQKRMEDMTPIKTQFDSLLRMIGMDYSKIGLMLLNALIFIVETVIYTPTTIATHVPLNSLNLIVCCFFLKKIATRYLGEANDISSAKKAFRVNDIFDVRKVG